jgi:hypothetical protein
MSIVVLITSFLKLPITFLTSSIRNKVVDTRSVYSRVNYMMLDLVIDLKYDELDWAME